MSEAIAVARELLRDGAGDRVRTDHPLAPLTSFRLGGPASLFFEPQDRSDLELVSAAVRASGVEMVVIGKGSNVLISDEGYPGLVLRLGKGFRWSARDGDRLSAGAAMPLPALAGVALAHGLTGLEFGVAIPATFGGSIRMNAGAHSRALDEVVEVAEVFVVPIGAWRTLRSAEIGFEYRRSRLPEGAVVVSATVLLRPGEPAAIRAAMDEARAWRRETQPLAEPNCGSVFKNPPGLHAAKLVEDAGAKGLVVGGARVSEKHANFIVAGPGATSADVHRLIAEVQRRVHDRFGVELETEVHRVGPFEGQAVGG